MKCEDCNKKIKEWVSLDSLNAHIDKVQHDILLKWFKTKCKDFTPNLINIIIDENFCNLHSQENTNDTGNQKVVSSQDIQDTVIENPSLDSVHSDVVPLKETPCPKFHLNDVVEIVNTGTGNDGDVGIIFKIAELNGEVCYWTNTFSNTTSPYTIHTAKYLKLHNPCPVSFLCVKCGFEKDSHRCPKYHCKSCCDKICIKALFG